MNLMDLVAGEWSAAAIAATADHLQSKLPPVVPSSSVAGTLAPYWRQRYGLPAAKVVVWSGDNPCSLIGTGAVSEGRLTISLGTSDTVFACTREPQFGASHIFRSPTGDYMNLVCFRNGSLARERVRDRYGLDWPRFNQALDATPVGNNGSLMLPWFEPEITPHVAVAGVRRFNLQEENAAANIRAVVEAQMMAMANHSAVMTSRGVDRIIATGGASANRAILQVMAGVFAADVYSLTTSNTASLGAALRAYHADQLADGKSPDWSEIVEVLTSPDPSQRVSFEPEHAAVYRERRRQYAALESSHRL